MGVGEGCAEVGGPSFLGCWDVGERCWREGLEGCMEGCHCVYKGAAEVEEWGFLGDQIEEITRLGMLSELDTIVALFL